MRGERTSDRDALINRYGLSRRLAARIVALLSKKVDVSPTLLEVAAADGALEAVLLDSALLTEPQKIEQDHIQAQARQQGFKDSDLLRLVGGSECWRTIALEDDVLAERVAGEADASLVGTELMRAAPGGISRLETEELFTPEQVARLKLTALTSQKMEERIEALRKLVFAPMGDSQKASIFVNTLTDPTADVRVRREAVRALEQIGLRSDLAETVRGLFDASEEDVVYAVRRLGALVEHAGEAERGVTLAAVLGLFDETDSQQVLSELLGLISHSAPTLGKSPQRTEQFVRSALRHLARRFEELRRGVEEALLACHREVPGVVGDLLWNEIGRSKDGTVRSFLVNFCSAVAKDDERLRELAEIAVREIVDPALLERERTQLRYGLVRLGEPAARTVIERLRGRTGRDCAELIRLLDVVCTEGDVTDSTVNEAVRVLLDQLQLGEQVSRRLILEAAICGDKRVEEPLQSRLAVELLAHITEFRLPGTAEAIYRTLAKIGPPAARPLFDYVVRRYPSDDAEDAFIGLGKIARAHGDAIPPELWQEVFDYAVGLFDDHDVKRGGFAIALAYMCGYGSAGARVFERVLNAMKERVWKARYTFEILDALGIMAGSENARPKHQRELFEMFDEIVHKEGPERIGVRRMTAEGPVYEFGAEVLFDTRAVPSLVRGLESICASEQATGPLRREVIKRLLTLWEGVSNVRVVWSPAAVDALVSAMCGAACCAQVRVDIRVRIARSLLRFLNKVSVVRSMGRICSQHEPHREMQQLCIEAGEKMLETWENCDQQDEERKVALLESVGKLAADTALDAQNPRVKRLRDNFVDVLCQALRSGIDEARAPLGWMGDCPDLPERQREEIRDRLSRYMGLVRLGR